MFNFNFALMQPEPLPSWRSMGCLKGTSEEPRKPMKTAKLVSLKLFVFVSFYNMTKVCTIPTFTDLTGSQLGIAIVRIGSSESLESSVTCMRVCVSILVCVILMINFRISHDTMFEQNPSMSCNQFRDYAAI